MIEVERRFFKERNKEIVEKLMKNILKEEFDLVEFKVSVIKSIYENVVKVSFWVDFIVICLDKSRNYM